MSTTDRVERKLVAILAADGQGYSRLMGADEAGTLRMLTAYREVIDTLLQHHRSRIVGIAHIIQVFRSFTCPPVFPI